MLFTMRYKRAMQGVQSGFVEVTRPTGDPAADLATAERIGRAFCDREPGYKFIAVTAAVLADDAEPAVAAPSSGAGAKKGGKAA